MFSLCPPRLLGLYENVVRVIPSCDGFASDRRESLWKCVATRRPRLNVELRRVSTADHSRNSNPLAEAGKSKRTDSVY